MKKIQGYTIREEVFKTHYSIQYKGIRERDNTPVFIKAYNTLYVTQAQIARFRQEFFAILGLKSKAFITVYGIEDYKDGLALILEDFSGIPIKEYSKNGYRDILGFLDVAIQLSKALGEIHHINITHKDIKPKNILINQETGKAKIIDFGLSSILTRENEHIYDPLVVQETLPYISPEQTGRMNRIMDYRTDFYSLGVIFYEILTETLPFRSDNPLEIFHGHIARMPKPSNLVQPEIPEAISDIIMKMLSKNPEDRYQSGYGIEADLEECLRQFKRSGKIEPFTIGKYDMPEKLIIPQKIYGREKEIDILMAAFDRTISGRSELMLVTGFAGIGKTVLVNELQKPIVRREGYFVAGKFDRLQMNKPYSAIIQAFAGLIRQMLVESDKRIKRWKGLIEEALGNNGRIITDIIPELELLIGKQPEVEELGPEESQNRFGLIFQNFVRLFARKEHPLAIFLDDLQWVDSASLNLIKTLISDPGTRYILFIGAFRDKEVTGSHPFALWVDNTKEVDITLSKITLRPLELATVNQLIADTMRRSPHESLSLAETVYRKTEGNPFFIKQFLNVIYDEDILSFSTGSGWRWDMNRLDGMEVADNVVDMMAAKMLRLSEGAQETLKLAAGIGSRFDPETLADISLKSFDETYADLSEAIEYGLLLSTDTGFKFIHDRIQEASYSLIPKEDSGKLRYKTGRLLLKRTSPEDIPEKLFSIVDQFNFSPEFITDKEERDKLAGLNLKAGIKAKASNAYESAYQYFRKGEEFLPPDVWEREYDLALSLYTLCGEAGYLAGDYEQAERYFDVVLEKAKSPLDKIRVYEVKIANYTTLNKRKEALDLGIDALSMLGLQMPKKADDQFIAKGMGEVRKNMKGMEVEDLINLPELKDPYHLAIVRLLMSCTVPAYTEYPQYVPIIVLQLLNLSLKHGDSYYSAFVYVAYGLILCGAFGDIEQGYRFGKLAIKTLDKFNARGLRAKVYYPFADMISHWKRHISDDVEYLLEAYRSGSETGDTVFASYAVNHYMMTSFFMGERLSILREKMEEYYQIIKKFKQLSVIQEYELWYQMVINLSGEADDKLRIKGRICDESRLVPELINKNQLTGLGYYSVQKQIILYLYGDFENAIDAARKGKDYLGGMAGMFFVAEYHFYYSLAMTAHFPDATIEEQDEYLKHVKANQEKMKNWASHAPDNFEHKYLLVAAEIERIEGKTKSAINLYDRAITLAGEKGFTQDEAIANELAAKFFIANDMEKIAMIYMREALEIFKRWGAGVKVSDLQRKYPHFLAESKQEKRDTSLIVPSDQPFPLTPSIILDYETVMKSSQVISSEIILEKLLESLMRIVIENAGANRGMFISVKDGNFYIEAERTPGNGDKTVVRPIPIDERDDLLFSALNYVKRTIKPIVLDDAGKEGAFITDPYVIKNQPKSILCLPVIRRSILVGILYLENNIVAATFTPDRVEILQLLATQVAISLENALLVDDMKKTEESLRESEVRFKKMFENMSSGVAVYQARNDGENFVIVDFNKAGEKIEGVRREDLIGRSVIEIFPGVIDFGLFDVFQRVWKTGTPEHHPISLYKDKRIVGWRENYVYRLPSGEIVAVYDDITERRQAEEAIKKYTVALEEARNSLEQKVEERTKELKKAQEKLLAAERLAVLGRFSGSMSHELRNPLGVIDSSAYYIMRKLKNTEGIEPKIEQHITRIRDQVKHSTAIIESLLNLTRMKEPKKKLIDLAGSVIDAISNSNVPRSIKVSKDMTDEEIFIDGDQEQIRMTFENIIKNAVEAMEGKGDLKIRVGTSEEKQSVEVTFEDTGCGIGPEDINKIFQPLFSTKAKGIGFGLSICRQIIEKHGGEIGVESEEGRGARFVVRLPVSPKDAKAQRDIGSKENER